MGSTYTIKYRDVGGILEVSLKDPLLVAFDLTPYSVYNLHIWLSDGTTKLTRSMTLFGPATNGVLRYSWVATDWDAGQLVISPTIPLLPNQREPRMEYEVRNAGSTLRRTFPTADWDTLRVIEDIAQG
jgi:hypothetical protein